MSLVMREGFHVFDFVSVNFSIINVLIELLIFGNIFQANL